MTAKHDTILNFFIFKGVYHTPDQSHMQQLLQQAMHYMQLQQFGKALNVCKKILASGYNHPQIHLMMAIAFGQTNKISKSKETFKNLISHFPNNAEIYYNFALILQNNSETKEALENYNKCLKINPNHISALNNAGSLELKNKNYSSAIKLTKQAHKRQPQNFDYLRNLIECYYQIGEYTQCLALQKPILMTNEANEQDYILALDALYKSRESFVATHTYKIALKLFPDNSEILNLAGLIEIDNKKYRIAYDYLTKAMYNYTHNIEYQMNQLTALSHYVENHTLILEKLKYLVDNNSNNTTVLEYAASLCENLSLSKPAKQFIKIGLIKEPKNSNLLLTKAKLFVLKKKYNKAIKILNNIDINFCTKNTEIEVAYEKARVLDKQHKYKKAWVAIEKANKVNQAIVKGQDKEHSYEMQSKQLIEDFNKNYKPKSFNKNKDNSQLVFVIGFPRSGTTLLERILSTHPQIQILEETNAINDLYMKINKKSGSSYFKKLSNLTEQESDQLRQSYINGINDYVQRNKNEVIVDKMPMNVNHLALIQHLFPQALVILTLRHPIDVCISSLMQNMLQVFSFKSAAQYYDSYMQVLQTYRAKLKLNIHTIKYEDLIVDKKSLIKDILSQINLTWVDEMDQHHTHVTRVNTPSYQQVNQPIYQDAKYRFQNYLKMINKDLNILDKWIKAYKYEKVLSEES